MGFVEIVLEGPGKNALGTELMIRVSEALASAGDAPVLLVGAGDTFSAGLNLKEVASLDAAAMQVFLRRLADVVERLFRHPGPTVACVNGHAIAGGCILAAVCDHRVGTTNPQARIGLNEVALGLQFPPTILEVLRYRVAKLEPVILSAALLSPADALAHGLLDELSDDPLATARARLAALAVHPREAYSAAKAALRSTVRFDPEAEQTFMSSVLPVWTSPELKERIRGFLTKR